MRVLKILNNNALLAIDENENEFVFLGNGVGFANKVGKEYVAPTNDKKFILSSTVDRSKTVEEIIETVSPEFIEISGEIIAVAEEKFDEVDPKILLPLADHIAFALERIEKKMEISNPFTRELELLFPEEYEIGKRGRDIIKAKTGIEINAAEISYITLHIHSAIAASHVSVSIQVVELIQSFIKELKDLYGIKIDEGSFSYNRFVTHVRYMMARIAEHETIDLDMNEYAKNNFGFSYEKAEILVEKLQVLLDAEIPQVENGYLALHIERIIKTAIEKEV